MNQTGVNSGSLRLQASRKELFITLSPGNRLQGAPGGFYDMIKVLFGMCGRYEDCLEGRWGKVNTAVHHHPAVELAIELEIRALGFPVVAHLSGAEEKSHHRADPVDRDWNGGCCCRVPQPLFHPGA